MRLLKEQEAIAKENLASTIFVEGAAGTGKTTAAIERIKNLLKNNVPAEQILVLVPQAGLAQVYRDALRRSHSELGGRVQFVTLGSLSNEIVTLFFPLIAEEAGFANPQDTPYFLSLELIQYYMRRFIEPEIVSQDWFNSVHISRNRLYTQIVDNLDKAALVRFDYQDIAERLKGAWRGDVEQEYIYDDAQAASSLFRDICLRYSLIDFSLQATLFVDYLWKMPEVKNYLFQNYRHLIVDNLEEERPLTHDILREWLPESESAVLIYDSDGGYRRFLGADPDNAYHLKKLCKVHVKLSKERVMSADVQAFQHDIAESLKRPLAGKAPKDSDSLRAIAYTDNRYHPQMIDWAVENIASLVHDEGVPPHEIVILAPYLPDALRFSLQTRLAEADVPSRSHRPSRSLREEPTARTLITLAKIAHPKWGLSASKFELSFALKSAISELDLIRARLLVDILYRNGELLTFERIQDESALQRISFDLGSRYDTLRSWIADYRANELNLPIDAFFSKLFGEVLSQVRFGFHANFDAANTAARLIDSAREFRQTVSKIEPDLATSSEYLRMVDAGVIANQYLQDWLQVSDEAVLIAPAYTFLMNNRAVDYQIWLNVGSAGWAQRLYQPLTHPYVLSRQWDTNRKWQDDDEHAASQDALSRLVLGLIRRCRKQIYLGFSQFGEQGFEQRGDLLMAIQSMLRRLQKDNDNV